MFTTDYHVGAQKGNPVIAYHQSKKTPFYTPFACARTRHTQTHSPIRKDAHKDKFCMIHQKCTHAGTRAHIPANQHEQAMKSVVGGGRMRLKGGEVD